MPEETLDDSGQQTDSSSEETSQKTKIEGNESVDSLPEWAKDHIKELRSEAASWRTKLREEQQKREEENMTEVEKQIDSVRKETEHAVWQKAQEQMIRVAARSKLVEEGIVNPNDRTLRLLDFENVSVEGEGKISGLEEAIENLKADYPTLKKNSTNPDLGNRQPTEQPMDMNSAIRRAAGR